MSLRRFVYKHTFPLHHWVVRKDMFRYYDEIQEFETKTQQQVEKYQCEKLSEMVTYSRKNIPYYTDSLADVDLSVDNTKEILNQIPILDKEAVRDTPSSFTNDTFADHKITTSGSTGSPLVMWANKAQLEKRLAMNLRNREWMGYDFADKSVRLWHQKIGMTTIQWLKEQFEAFLSREKFIPVFKMGDDNLGKIVAEIDDYDPELIDGYAEAYKILVDYCKRRHIQTDWNRVVSSGQTLYPSTREGIEEYLGAEVFDRYGAREFSGIAQECQAHDGKHINSYLYIVEVLTDDGEVPDEGEEGNIVITDLHNRATPLIRYKVGDLAHPVQYEDCECGLSWPKLGKIVGRQQSVIVTADGKKLPGTFFDHYFKEYYHVIKQWQVVQKTKDTLDVNVMVTSESDFEEIRPQLRQGLRKHIGDVDVTFHIKDDMEMVRTGKFRHTISEVAE